MRSRAYASSRLKADAGLQCKLQWLNCYRAKRHFLACSSFRGWSVVSLSDSVTKIINRPQGLPCTSQTIHQTGAVRRQETG